MELETGVYCILNTDNGKTYFGSTRRSFHIRWQDHRNLLNAGAHANRYLQRAWTKHGAAAFDFSIVEVCEPDRCLVVEQGYLDANFDGGKECYNLSPTAGSNFGVKFADEVRWAMAIRMHGVPMKDWIKDKISEALTGRELSDEHKANLWRNRQGWTHSEESKQKTSETLRGMVERGEFVGYWKGKQHSEETKAKMSKAGKGKPKSDEHKAKIAAALRGKRHTEERKANIAKAKRKNHD